jgi:hypothetical protein
MKNASTTFSNTTFSVATFCVAILSSVCLTPRAYSQSDSLNAELTDASQAKTVGTLVEFTADHVTMQVDGAETLVDVSDISMLTFGNSIAESDDENADQASTSVSLVDGSKLLTKNLTLNNRTLDIKMTCDIDASISVRNVKPILFRPLEPPLTEKMWDDEVDKSSKSSDGLVVSRKGKLQTIEGVVGGISNEEVSFTVDEQTRKVQRERLQGVYFFQPTLEDFAAPFCQAILTDGSKINVRRIDIEESAISVTSVCGAEFKMTSASIAEFNFASSRAVFLSDLEPTSNDWVPLIAHSMIVKKLKPFRLPRRNRSMRDEPLSLVLDKEFRQLATAQQVFSNGFSIGGGGKLAFTLNGQFKTLTGLVGFDPEADASGVVRFVIQVDGKAKVDERLENATLNQPIDIDIDVTNAKRLVIKVDYEDGRNVGDQIHFVDPKLSR